MLFDLVARTDAKPSRCDETRFQFLNRSASTYFGVVRDLLEDWLSRVPPEHRSDLIARMKKDNFSHSAAFWELYLHEGYRRSCCELEIHPKVSGSSNRPDFRIHAPGGSFYLEAVRVGVNGSKVASDRRLDVVHQVLADMRLQDFKLLLVADRVGSVPPPTKRLRAKLKIWVAGLDPDEVFAAISGRQAIGRTALPRFRWNHDDWELTFTAFPLSSDRRGVDRQALGAVGSGAAGIVDNVSGLHRVLEAKHGRYGSLDLPLVIAVESNTVIPTSEFEIDQALYGLSALRPHDSRRGPSDLAKEGFWFGRNGWRRGDTPQVITSAGIDPWSVASRSANLWTTLESATPVPSQPAWLSPVVVGVEAVPSGAIGAADHFGIDEVLISGSPDFGK